MENPGTAWSWFAFCHVQNFNVAAMMPYTWEELSKGLPPLLRMKNYTVFQYIKRKDGQGIDLKLSALPFTEDGGESLTPKEAIEKICQPDQDLIEALNRQWKKQSILTPSAMDTVKIGEDKKRFQVEKGGR